MQPFYILIDCSSSMKGDAIEAVDQALKNLITKLRDDPYLYNIIWLSIIAFDSTPRQLFPLRPIECFTALPLAAGGSSNLGKALRFLNRRINKEVARHTKEQRGDGTPLVFLMTDGQPTDNWEKVSATTAQEIKLIACGMGATPNVSNLKKITENTIRMKDMTREAFDQLIDFMRNTTTAVSQLSNGLAACAIDQDKYNKLVLTGSLI